MGILGVARAPEYGLGPLASQRSAVATALAGHLPAASLQSVTSLARVALLQPFKRNSRLLPPDLAVLVLSGHLAVLQPYVNGRQEMIAIAAPGEFLGALTVAHGSTSVDLVGLESGLAARWRPATLRAAAARDPALTAWLFAQAQASAAWLYERVERNATKQVTARLAEVLWRYRGLMFGRARPLLSREQLAELVGATREMTMRSLRDLERQRILRRVRPRGLRLLDAERLREACGCMEGLSEEPAPLRALAD